MTFAFAITPQTDPALYQSAPDAIPCPKPPRGIALVGFPGAGKTLVAGILTDLYGVRAVDDGFVLREFAVKHLGLDWDDVMTQFGKQRYTNILGRTWQNREILGEFGKMLEALFGEHILPFIAVQGLSEDQIYSFPSVRKTQGWFYREWGGIVAEVVKDGTQARFDFDQYDETSVQLTINNHTMDYPTLVREVKRVFDPILAPQAPQTDARFDVV